eukprot:2162726-Rhodomonas_salina.1
MRRRCERERRGVSRRGRRRSRRERRCTGEWRRRRGGGRRACGAARGAWPMPAGQKRSDVVPLSLCARFERFCACFARCIGRP